jgi:hypothetical protein
VITPDGSTLSSSSSAIGTDGGSVNLTALPTSGTYTILLDPYGVGTGAATLTLSDDVTDTVVENGDPVTDATTRVGQNLRLTFDASTGDAISAQFTAVTVGSSSCCSTNIAILAPDGSTLKNSAIGTDGGYVEATSAPSDGTYTVFVDPASTATGSVTVRLNPPKSTVSRYMGTVNTTTVNGFGNSLGAAVLDGTRPQKSLVVLDYGCQTQDTGGAWGTIDLSTNTFRNMSDIEAAVEAYGQGFYEGTGSDVTAQLTIVLGTNNYCTVSTSAGHVWADAVDSINSYFASHPSGYPYAQQVIAVGGNDFEIGFCRYDPCPANARAWADAFGTYGSWWYDNYGSCDGCPPVGSTPDGDWTSDDIWYVSWGAVAAIALPEIYENNGVNAAQWERISEHGYTAHYSPIGFDGVLTENAACSQVTCDPALDNTPNQGWTQLWKALNVKAEYDNHVPSPAVHDSLQFATDIQWPS